MPPSSHSVGSLDGTAAGRFAPMRGLSAHGYANPVLIYLAVAASLMALTIIIRIVRFAFFVAAVALMVLVVSGHAPLTVGHLAQLL